jgi:hypothetical protein
MWGGVYLHIHLSILGLWTCMNYLCGVLLGKVLDLIVLVRNLVYLFVMLVISHFIDLYIMSYASRFIYHTYALVYTI